METLKIHTWNKEKKVETVLSDITVITAFVNNDNNYIHIDNITLEQCQVFIVHEGIPIFTGTIEQLKARLHQSEPIQNQTDKTAIEKIRTISNWSDSQDEGFNLKIKTIADWEKLYEFSVQNEIGYVDWDGLYNHTDTSEECTQLADHIEKMLGYKVY